MRWKLEVMGALVLVVLLQMHTAAASTKLKGPGTIRITERQRALDEVDLGSRGHWQWVLAGAYTDEQAARLDAERLKSAAPGLDARVISAGLANGFVTTAAHQPESVVGRSGTQP